MPIPKNVNLLNTRMNTLMIHKDLSYGKLTIISLTTSFCIGVIFTRLTEFFISMEESCCYA